MATLFATGVSAASGLTVHVTSNLTNLFPEADVTMDDSEGMVKVTYFINTPEYKIMDCEWTLEYDGTKLTPELKTGGLNVNFKENGEIESYRFMRFAKNLSDQVINTDPHSYRNRADGVRAIYGNISSSRGFKNTDEGKKEFVTAYFKINSGATGTANVKLNLRTMQACPISATGSEVVRNTEYLIRQNDLQSLEKIDIKEVLPQLQAENQEEYRSGAEQEAAPLSIGYALSLKDSFKVKVYLYNVTREMADIYSVEVTYKGTTRTSATDSTLKLKAIAENELLLADTHAPDMTQKAHMVIRDGNGTIVKARDYSVQGYCEQLILQTQESENYKNLCRAVLNYGAESQLFFGKDTEHLANGNSELNCDSLLPYPDVPETYELQKAVDNFDYGVTMSFTLKLDSETQLDLFFEPGQGEDISQYTFSVVPPVGSSARYTVSTTSEGKMYVKIYQITPRSLADTFSVVVTGPNSGTKTYCLSALTYAYRAQSADQQNVVKALYQLYLATEFLRES